MVILVNRKIAANGTVTFERRDFSNASFGTEIDLENEARILLSSKICREEHNKCAVKSLQCSFKLKRIMKVFAFIQEIP